MLVKVLCEFVDVQVVVLDCNCSGVFNFFMLEFLFCIFIFDNGDIVVQMGMLIDCVYLGVNVLMCLCLDIVVFGINVGLNLGDDVIYFGIVVVVMEGCYFGFLVLVVFFNGYQYYDMVVVVICVFL